ncbi:hypothetical protein ETQ85_06385 [Zoogloea oleivorans]|uniref:Cell surface protein n=1 Tax=Zoogloea oleivorans TaxID=1552750 RepID=A0A6C2D3G6_9RHOO|nr:hypothetical protein [Zoogloea oleivorans]TYC60132.1 hypothetical protein ETQ85_06385 [Zoogloea oleivorans]
MKKSLLAVGVAATLGALSGVSNAAMTVAQNGVGQINILPYYTVQNGNTTLISIANTDELNGKAVKVRFRGAQFSDDVFDFQVFLSPADVWTAAVTLDGNVARLTTNDNSCTLPAKADLNQKFVTARLLDANKAQGTREGYVEIINMGDIPVSAVPDSLYVATKHVNGVAPCTTAVLIGDVAAPNDLTGKLTNPKTGLTSFATIINVANSKAFTVPATALNQIDGVTGLPSLVVPVRYSRQANLTTGTLSFGSVSPAFASAQTADSVFDPATGNVKMYEFDLPDLSTPYGTANAAAQLAELQTALAKGSVVTEYATDDSILASTDVVLSQPTRRYYYTWTDTPTAATDPLRTLATVDGATGVYSSLDADTNSVTVGAPSVYDREERTVSAENNIVISPNPQGSATWTLIGEVSVVSINNGAGKTGALGAEITAQDYTFAYNDGLVRLSTTAGVQALPVIGFTAVNVFNASAGGAAGTNYGQVLPLKWNTAP